MTDIYRSEVTYIGDGAQDMFDAGVYILFADPVPSALAEISLVHSGRNEAGEDPHVQPGDRLLIGEVEMTVDEVGDLANRNLADLGHSVVYLNQPKQNLLPGAIKATGEQKPSPKVGDQIVFVRG